jgi:AraC-like DNA-binding protein
MTIENYSNTQNEYATPDMSLMKFTIIPPPENLLSVVECFRISEYTGEAGLSFNITLNGLPGIVFQQNKGRSPVESIISTTRVNDSIPTLYIYGQQTEPSVMNIKEGPFTTTQVILKPHALKTLLGLDASVLTNGFAELTGFSAGDINDQLLGAKTEPDRLTLLTNFLIARLQKAKSRDRLIEESLNIIHKNIGLITVGTLLKRLNISERQFERRFRQTVGISPQFYIRVKRFNEAVKLMKTRQFEKLTDIAYALNFYDQSHFIRDTKAFSGNTPKRLSQKKHDFLHGRAGYFYL